MDGINQGFVEKKIDQSKLEEKTLHCNQLLAEVATFQAKLDAFRLKIPNVQQKVGEIDSTIAKYKVEIQSLELQKTAILEKDDLMRKEASAAILKVKESKMSQQDITTLVDNGKALDERLTDFKSQLDQLTSEFKL
jgi:chromosome segregation ATPase